MQKVACRPDFSRFRCESLRGRRPRAPEPCCHAFWLLLRAYDQAALPGTKKKCKRNFFVRLLFSLLPHQTLPSNVWRTVNQSTKYNCLSLKYTGAKKRRRNPFWASQTKLRTVKTSQWQRQMTSVALKRENERALWRL